MIDISFLPYLPIKFLLANNVGPDRTLRFAVSELGIPYLNSTQKRVSGLKRVKCLVQYVAHD